MSLMRVDSFEVYVPDGIYLLCKEAGCTAEDSDIYFPGRRVAFSNVITAITQHAIQYHGVTPCACSDILCIGTVQ